MPIRAVQQPPPEPSASSSVMAPAKVEHGDGQRVADRHQIAAVDEGVDVGNVTCFGEPPQEHFRCDTVLCGFTPHSVNVRRHVAMERTSLMGCRVSRPAADCCSAA